MRTPCNQDTYICPKGVQNRGVPCYSSVSIFYHIHLVLTQDIFTLSSDCGYDVCKLYNYNRYFFNCLSVDPVRVESVIPG